MYDTMMVVDQYQRYHDGLENSYRVNNKLEANQLGTWLAPFGNSHRRLAVVYEKDRDGLLAYTDAGFTTLTMNGNRQQELTKVIADELRHLKNNPPKQLVLVTADPTFDLMLAGLANTDVDIAVWNPTNKPSSTFSRYNYMQLDELLNHRTKIEVQKWSIFVDYENIHIGLSKQGWEPNPKEIINGIHKAMGEGKLLNIVAYADWEKLKGETKRNYQSELYDLGVKTQYQKNMNGKNTGDIEIIVDIHSALASQTKADVIAIVSGDRDFRRIIDEIKDADKQAVIMTLKDSVSRELEKAAERVIYLDSYMKLVKANRPKRFRVGTPNPEDRLTQFAMKAFVWMFNQRWGWAYQDRLERRLNEIGDFTKEDVEEALKIGLFVEVPDREDAITVNAEDSTGKAIRQLTYWLPNKVDYFLNKKRNPMKSIDMNFVVKKMMEDQKLKDAKLGFNWGNAKRWLRLAEAAGLVETRRMPHFRYPNRKVITFWLPGEAPEEEADPSQPSQEAAAKVAQPETPVEAEQVEGEELEAGEQTQEESPSTPVAPESNESNSDLAAENDSHIEQEHKEDLEDQISKSEDVSSQAKLPIIPSTIS